MTELFNPTNPVLYATLLASLVAPDGAVIKLALAQPGERATAWKYPAKLGLTVASQSLIGIPIYLVVNKYLGISGTSIESAIITFAAIYGVHALIRVASGRSVNSLFDNIIYYE